jgi:hypothetical protein
MKLFIDGKQLWVRNTWTEDEILMKALSRLSWPKNHAYLEIKEGVRVEIRNDAELRFASRLLSEFLFDPNRQWNQEIQAIELSAAKHMDLPDSEPEDNVMHSDDDMTQEDFYMLGFRHEITNG